MEVILFYVVTTLRRDVQISVDGAGTITVPYNESELEQMKADAMKYLEEVGGNLRNEGATVLFKVGAGQNPADEIIKTEEEVNADLVAMSTRGRAGINRWAFGNVTDKILIGGKVSVLMVRAS